MNRNKRKKREL